MRETKNCNDSTQEHWRLDYLLQLLRLRSEFSNCDRFDFRRKNPLKRESFPQIKRLRWRLCEVAETEMRFGIARYDQKDFLFQTQTACSS